MTKDVRAFVVEQFGEIFSDAEQAMRARWGQLGNRTVDEALEAGDFDRVMDLIDTLKSGGFA